MDTIFVIILQNSEIVKIKLKNSLLSIVKDFICNNVTAGGVRSDSEK